MYAAIVATLEHRGEQKVEADQDLYEAWSLLSEPEQDKLVKGFKNMLLSSSEFKTMPFEVFNALPPESKRNIKKITDGSGVPEARIVENSLVVGMCNDFRRLLRFLSMPRKMVLKDFSKPLDIKEDGVYLDGRPYNPGSKEHELTYKALELYGLDPEDIKWEVTAALNYQDDELTVMMDHMIRECIDFLKVLSLKKFFYDRYSNAVKRGICEGGDFPICGKTFPIKNRGSKGVKGGWEK